MKRATRRQIQAWLAPMRKVFAEIKGGECDSIRGYAVTLLPDGAYARVDFCIAGFRALLSRLCTQIDVKLIERIEKKLAAGVPLNISEIYEALSLLNRCEDALIKHPVDVIKDAVLTEQICIELDELEIRRSA